MVKKAKLLLPLVLSLTSIFCVGYAGWTLSGTGVSTSVNASVGDVINMSDYISFDTSVAGTSSTGIEPLEYVSTDSYAGFSNDGKIGNSGLIRLHFDFNIKKYYEDFNLSGTFNCPFIITLGANSYISSTYVDSINLSLNSDEILTRYIYPSLNATYGATRPTFTSLSLNSNTGFSQFNGSLSFPDNSTYITNNETLYLKLCFDLLFNFNSSQVNTIINNINDFTFDIGVSF